jgi:hypothetical protein
MRNHTEFSDNTSICTLQLPSRIESISVVENFIDEPFDMLINLTLEDNFALDYISSVSKAGLKIGRAESAVAFCYDMTFFLDKDADLRSFAYTIIHYLSNINNEKQASIQRNRSSHYYTI